MIPDNSGGSVSASEIWACVLCGALDDAAHSCGCSSRGKFPRLQCLDEKGVERLRYRLARKVTREILEGELISLDIDYNDNWREQRIYFELVAATDKDTDNKAGRRRFVSFASIVGRARAAWAIGPRRSEKFISWLMEVPVDPEWQRSSPWIY